MKTFLIISLCLISTALFSAQSQLEANKKHLQFMRRSSSALFNVLSQMQPASSITKEELEQLNIPALQAIARQAEIILFVNPAFSFTRPTEAQQTECVQLRGNITRYQIQLQSYEEALARLNATNPNTN